MELLKLLSANELVAQTVAFLLLLFIMRSVFWKKFLTALDKRRDRIASELKKIDETKTAVEMMKAEYEEKLTKIEEVAEVKFIEAAEKARKFAEEVRLKAEHEGERIIQNAKESVRGELLKAKEELKDTMVDLTIEVAGKVIEERLTEANDKKLVEEFLKRLGTK